MATPFPNMEPAWGLRAYLVLIGCAADHQTVTYDALAHRIKAWRPKSLGQAIGPDYAMVPTAQLASAFFLGC
jgi:hypothetical protein